MFLSSHVLSEVERVCDRVAIVRAAHLATLETTESLLEKRRKRVTLVFDRPVDATPFAQLAGVSDVTAQGTTISLRLRDGIDGVVKLAAQHTLIDLTIVHPTLDEVFMGYYEVPSGRVRRRARRSDLSAARYQPGPRTQPAPRSRPACVNRVDTHAHDLRRRLRSLIIWAVVVGRSARSTSPSIPA